MVRRKHCGATGVPVPCCRNLSRYVGQPTSFSHPELLNKDESEFEEEGGAENVWAGLWL